MEGLRLIAGLDPAVSGHTAAVLLGLDRVTGKRWLIDVANRQGMKPDEMRELIKEWTVKYGIHEWRIEKNAFQGFLTQDSDVRSFLATRGVTLADHFTGNNKHDAEFGVAAMSHLFEMGLIRLPRAQTESVKALVAQLISWQPKLPKGVKTDIVMALWFAELRCQELVDTAMGGLHTKSIFQTRYDKSQQRSVTYEDFRDESLVTAGSWWR
jgi:hypothetical protein